MALNAYITVTAIPSIFLGTAGVMIYKDPIWGIIYLAITSGAYCIFLIIDHANEMEKLEHMYPRTDQ